MGACFGRSQRWYYPRKPVMDMPTLLNKQDEEKVLTVWVEGRRKKLPIDDIIKRAGKELKAPTRECDHFISIVELQRVTPQMLIHVLGIMCKGDRMAIARLMFDMIDQDGSGELDRGELAELVRLTAPTGVYDTSYARRVAGEIMTFADSDRSGTLDWDEFLSAQDAIAHKLSQVLVESKRRQRFEVSNAGTSDLSAGKGLAMIEHCGDWHSNNPNSAPFGGWLPKVTETHKPPPKKKPLPKKGAAPGWKAGVPESPAGVPKPSPPPPGNPLSKLRSAAAATALLQVGGAGPPRHPVGSSMQNSSRDSTDNRGLTGCSPSLSRASSMRRSGSVRPAATPDLPRGLSLSRLSGSRPPSSAADSGFGGTPAAAPFGRRASDRRMSSRNLTGNE